MNLDILFIIIANVFFVLGLIGCIVPVLPGPPLAYIGILFIHFTEKFHFTIPRKQEIHGPLVEGFTSIRLQSPVINVSGYQALETRMTMINDGPDTVSVQCVGTDDYISGPRFNIGSAIAVVPSGQKVKTFQPLQQYLELKSVSGTADFRFILEGRAEWQKLAFDKTETIFPPSLYKISPDLHPIVE